MVLTMTEDRTDPDLAVPTDWPGAIRELLRREDWTRDEAALQIDVSRAAVDKWMDGTRTPAGLYRKALIRALERAGITAPAGGWDALDRRGEGGES